MQIYLYFYFKTMQNTIHLLKQLYLCFTDRAGLQSLCHQNHCFVGLFDIWGGGL